MQYPRRGRPTAEDQKEVVGYHLEGSLEEHAKAINEAKHCLGRFIIATNDLDAKHLSATSMLENYKDQGASVERGFRFLKDPLFFAHSLFLKETRTADSLVDDHGALVVDLLTCRTQATPGAQGNERNCS